MEQLVQTVRQLDAGYNLVSLAKLRTALRWSRTEFDRQLQCARRAGLLTCSAGERDLTPDQLSAGIKEDGALLCYVSVRG